MKLRLFLACLLTLSLGSCGEDANTKDALDSLGDAVTTDTKDLRQFKPCDLVTKAEAEAAYGGPMEEGQFRNDVIPSCLYGTADLKRIGDNVQVQIQQARVFDGSKTAWKSGTDTGFTFEEVKGIGDDAFFQITGDGTGAVPPLLGFKKSGVAIYISVDNENFSVDQKRSAAKQLAEKAASRL